MMSKQRKASTKKPKAKIAKPLVPAVARSRSRSRTPSNRLSGQPAKKPREPRSLSFEGKKPKKPSQHNLTVIVPAMPRASSRKRSLSMSTSHAKQKRVRIFEDLSSSPDDYRRVVSVERKNSFRGGLRASEEKLSSHKRGKKPVKMMTASDLEESRIVID